VNFGQILDRIAQMGPGDPNVARRPPTELVAFSARWSRSLLQWKQQTLASFAGVALSTVERVERAERVSDASLDRIAVALGHEPGYLTSPRLPLEQDKAIGRFVEIFGEMEPVPVRRISTEAQIRRFRLCHGCLIHRHVEVDAENDALISELWEWFDLGSL
jgi:transcriptional regulator with XRE-family HTH domain